MTRDAIEALARAGFSPRDFLKTSGAVIVGFSAAAIWERAGLAQGQFDTRVSHVDPKQLDSWIAIAADGRVTAYTGKCEFGQGIFTAQMQLVAEELSVPIDRVALIQCDTAVCPDQGTTSGSQSTPANFNEHNLAQAAATARETLVRMASKQLGVAVDRHRQLLGDELHLRRENPLSELAFPGVRRHPAVSGNRNPRVELFGIDVRGTRVELPLGPPLVARGSKGDDEDAGGFQEVASRQGRPRVGGHVRSPADSA